MARDVPRSFARQEAHRSRNIPIVPIPRQRNLRQDPRLLRVRQLLGHRRLDKSRSNRVHRNPPAGKLPRQRLRQPDQPGLRRRIVRLPRRPRLADHRRDVDHPSPAALHHRRNHRLRQQESARKVRPQHLLKVRQLHPQRQPILGNPGIIHQNLHLPQVRQHRLRASLDRLLATHIQRIGLRLTTRSSNLCGHGLQLFDIPRGQRHRRSGPSQLDRASPPNPLAGTSNQRDSSRQPSRRRRRAVLRLLLAQLILR